MTQHSTAALEFRCMGSGLFPLCLLQHDKFGP